MQNIDKKMINKETVNMDNIINIRYKLGYGFMIRIKRMVFSWNSIKITVNKLEILNI